MSAMTDEQVKAVLNKINILYPSLFGIAKTYLSPDKQVWTDVFRRLAEMSLRDRQSQQALGEIHGLLQHQLDNEEPDDLVTILQLLDVLMIIATKHWKGGKP